MSNTTKDKRLAFRLDEQTFTLLNWIIEAKKYKKSQIFREALEMWMVREISGIKHSERTTVQISQNVLRLLFDSLSEQEISNVVHVQATNHITGIQEFHSSIENSPLDKWTPDISTVDGMLSFLQDRLFGPRAPESLDVFEYQRMENTIIFSMEHQRGKKYHLYLAQLLQVYLQPFGYSLEETIEHSIQSKYIGKLRLVFLKKE